MVALQRVPLDPDELLGRVVRPGREHHVANGFGLGIRERGDGHIAVVQRELGGVVQEGGEAEPLGRELLHVALAVETAVPRGLHRVEETVVVVEAAVLEIDVEECVRFRAHQIVQNVARRGVVGSIHEGRHDALGVLHLHHALVALQEGLQTLLVQGTHRFGQVAVHGRIVQVDGGGGVVSEDPREHGVLTEALVGAAADEVEAHEVVEGGDAVAEPLLRERELAEQLRGRRDPAEEEGSRVKENKRQYFWRAGWTA